MKNIAILLFGAMFSAQAMAVTYIVNSAPYGINSPPWSADMLVSFQFSVPERLPANFGSLYYNSVNGIVPPGNHFPVTITSWSLNDGVHTYNQDNSEAIFSLRAGSNGATFTLLVSVYSPEFTVPFGTESDRMDLVYLGARNVQSAWEYTAFVGCTLFDGDNSCPVTEQGPDYAYLNVEGRGGTAVFPYAWAIPVLSRPGTGLLILMLVVFGLRARGHLA